MATSDIDKLRAQIAKLTERSCESRNLNYLTQRLAALKKKKASGERMPNAPRGDQSAVVSISLTRRRTDLLAQICKDKGEGVSAVLRDAFDLWCAQNGYALEIRHIKRLGAEQ